MEPVNYILSTAIVFLGPFIGAVLAFISPEELKPGKKYFLLLKNILFVLIMVAVVAVSVEMILYSAALAVLLLIAFFVKNDILSYAALGYALFLSSFSDYFTVIAASVFVYGLPLGTLLASKNVKKRMLVVKHVFLGYVWFAVAAIGFYTINFFMK